MIAVGTRDPYYGRLRAFHDAQEKAGGGPYAWLELDKAPTGFIDRHEPYTREAWTAIRAYLKDSLAADERK